MHTKRFITFLKIWMQFRVGEIPGLPCRRFEFLILHYKMVIKIQNTDIMKLHHSVD